MSFLTYSLYCLGAKGKKNYKRMLNFRLVRNQSYPVSKSITSTTHTSPLSEITSVIKDT